MKNNGRAKTQINSHADLHKFWIIISLILVFICGFMAGFSINKAKIVKEQQGLAGAIQEKISERDEQFNQLTLCEKVEKVGQVNPDDYCLEGDEWSIGAENTTATTDKNACEALRHSDNARSYAYLAQCGCINNNFDKYKNLALLEIERAIPFIKNYGDLEQLETAVYNIYDTYFAFNMQNEARAFVNELEKMSNPVPGFVLRLDRNVNEWYH